MSAIEDKLKEQEKEVYAINLEPNDASVSLRILARQLLEFIDENVEKELQIDIIGFSMGGIVSRIYIQNLLTNPEGKVINFISISSPNHGTKLANMQNNEGSREMLPESDLLNELNSEEKLRKLRLINCYWLWTSFDLMIIPPHSSIMPGIGDSVMIPAATHPLMLSDKRLLEKISNVISDT